MWKWAVSQHASLLQRCRQEPFVIWPKMASLEPVLESEAFRKCGILSPVIFLHLCSFSLTLSLSPPESCTQNWNYEVTDTSSIYRRIYQNVSTVSPVCVPLSWSLRPQCPAIHSGWLQNRERGCDQRLRASTSVISSSLMTFYISWLNIFLLLTSFFAYYKINTYM